MPVSLFRIYELRVSRKIRAMRELLTGRHLMPVDSIVVIEALYFISRLAWGVFVFPVVEEFREHPVRTEFVFFPEDPKGGELGVCETHLEIAC